MKSRSHRGSHCASLFLSLCEIIGSNLWPANSVKFRFLAFIFSILFSPLQFAGASFKNDLNPVRCKTFFETQIAPARTYETERSLGLANHRSPSGPIVDSDRNSLLQQTRLWLSDEKSKGVPEEHQKQVLWGDVPGKIAETSVLFIHGLYNSPHFLKPLLPAFTNEKTNIMMTRLSGHFEADYGELRNSINWRVWLDQAESDFAFARKMGKKVILVGHSTGGLLATWLALRYPQDVSGLILFSPAYGVAPWTQFLAWVSDISGVSFTKSTGQIVVGHAGREVTKATKYFAGWIARNEKKQSQFVAETLSAVPIWMNNTKLDLVISQRRAENFFLQVSERNPLNSPRQSRWIPLSKMVLHDQITTEANPELELTIESIKLFLRSPPI